MACDPHFVLDAYWSHDAPELLAALATNPRGLSSAEAARRLKRHGPNLVTEQREVAAVRLLLRSVPAPVQVAGINDRVFLVNASLGLYPDLLEEIIALVREDAEFFGCVAEIEHARHILSRGTSAHRQVALYRRAVDDGMEHDLALRQVVDQLIAETMTFE